MPSKPKRICSKCKRGKFDPTTNSCSVCGPRSREWGQRKQTAARAVEVQWRNSSRWRGPSGLRQNQLQRQPLCEECYQSGRVVPACHVDHVVAARGDAELFFNSTNLRSLCHACHSRKTAREDTPGRGG